MTGVPKEITVADLIGVQGELRLSKALIAAAGTLIIELLRREAYQDPESYEWVVELDKAIAIVRKECGIEA